MLQGRLREVYSAKVRRAIGGRRQEVMLAQMRAGHDVDSAYYQARIGAREGAECPRCSQTEDKDHWLECGAWAVARAECEVTGLDALRDEEKMVKFLRRVGRLQ